MSVSAKQAEMTLNTGPIRVADRPVMRSSMKRKAFVCDDRCGNTVVDVVVDAAE